MFETKYTHEVLDDLNEKLEKYIKETYIPIVAEFAYLNNIRRQALYEHKPLSDTIKKLIYKKEANLERDGLDKSKFTPMHAFSLKQLGWKDRQEIERDEDFNFKEIADAIRGSDTSKS